LKHISNKHLIDELGEARIKGDECYEYMVKKASLFSVHSFCSSPTTHDGTCWSGTIIPMYGHYFTFHPTRCLCHYYHSYHPPPSLLLAIKQIHWNSSLSCTSSLLIAMSKASTLAYSKATACSFWNLGVMRFFSSHCIADYSIAYSN
jgi:hypothetical protein